jgi:hypothetical protein
MHCSLCVVLLLALLSRSYSIRVGSLEPMRDCQMFWSGHNIDASDLIAQRLMVQVRSDPADKLSIHRGKTMLSSSLFSEKGIVKNDEVVSFSVLRGAAYTCWSRRWVVW